MTNRIMFLRDTKNHPVGCVAINFDFQTSQLSYQLSVLNPNDKFDRKMARHLALGRLVERPFSVTIPAVLKYSMHDVTFLVMSDISNNIKSPSRAKKAAQLWLHQNSV